MQKYFYLINFKLRLKIQKTDITKYLDKIISSDKEKGTLTTENNEEISYEKNENNKIKIILNGQERTIDAEPISFINEKGETIFKVYDKNLLNTINEALSIISSDYNFYNKENQIISKEELSKTNDRIITLKLKNKELENLFAPLFKEINIENDAETINTNLFLPFKSENLNLEFNSAFQLVIKQRIPLITKLQEYLRNEQIIVIKIYGSDGIGKSISYLFFTTIKNQFKSIYFNLKDVFKQNKMKEYFIKSLMKYYRNYDSDNSNDLDISWNYTLYKTHKDILEEEDTEDFWELLKILCEEIQIFTNSVIIIDQFKHDYDEKNQLNEIIELYQQKGTIKFIISCSLNDNTVKEDFISNLKYFFKKRDNIEETIVEETDIEDIIFRNFSFDSKIEQIEHPNNDFSKIIIFNENLEDTESDENTEKEKNEKPYFEKISISYPLYDITKIIYINNLVSMEYLVEEENKKYYEIFEYNPKTYNEFAKFLSSNKYELNEENYINFLEFKFSIIEEKIIEFYKNLKLKNSLKESEENLKGTYLIKLMGIIKERKIIDLQTLIKYLKIFPFKYLKIYLADGNKKQKINFIDIKEDLNNNKFILDYAYEFVKLAFLKIINKITSSTTIDMKELTGSGIGPFLENKIKIYIQKIKKPKILIRYFWNFTSVNSTDIQFPEDKYDFETYKPIEYDDIKKNKINDYKTYYYIIPGSQTNRSLDAIILIPNENNTFNSICLQITKRKKVVKSKKEYIDDCFIAKNKLEANYAITIENVYFYFILAEDYINEDTKASLELYDISYFYFSIKDEIFKKNDKIINLTDLCRTEARITQELDDSEYKSFQEKNDLIKLTENYLIKKRKRERTKKFNITEEKYEMARTYIFKLSGQIYLDTNQIKEMKKIVENNKRIKGKFTFIYVYNINLNEYTFLINEPNLIGIIVDEEERKSDIKRKYYYYYLGQFHPEIQKLSCKIYSSMLNSQVTNKRIHERKKNYYLKEVPIKLCDSIFVFKIYEINN